VGRSIVGNYENGVIIHFQIKGEGRTILEARYKAYGNCTIIAACSYTTLWLSGKNIEEVKKFNSQDLIEALSIPALKTYCALVVEDAMREALRDYEAKINILAAESLCN